MTLPEFLLRSPYPEALALVAVILVALGANEVAFHLLRRARGRWVRALSSAIALHCWWPARVTVVALVTDLMLPILRPPAALRPRLDQLLSILLIVAVAWVITGLSFALEDVALARYRLNVRDNLKARRVHTQVMVIRRLTAVMGSLLAVAVLLTTFTGASVLGTSLLASAGIAGVIVGIAARPLITNLLAGVQILFSEPIRLDDVVVVEGQWGRVEEIRFTYVVVRIWDDRRLLLPISYFVEHPFENWTRSSAEVLATASVSVDFTVPVEDVRQELQRILERSALWDHRTWNLQVTDAGHERLELRALMSAPDAPTAWDLRCEVREKLVSYLQERYPQSLPRTRVELTGEDSDVARPAQPAADARRGV
jgi:small-conductance mechanosensitive channel